MDALVVACRACGARNRKPLSRLAERPVCGACKAELPRGGGPVDVDDAAFTKAVKHAQVPVLVDFWATWCGPCRQFAPVLQQYAAAHADDVLVLKVDTDEQPRLAAQFGITAIPTTVLFKDGREVARQAGALPGSTLDRFVKQAA